MEKRIRISAGPLEVVARLNDSRTSSEIFKRLPIAGAAKRWGKEIYFSIPLEMDLEEPREAVEVGDLAYWPPGRALCLFFGPTPISKNDEIRPASAVSVVGKIEGDPTILDNVLPGTGITLAKLDDPD